VVFPIETTLQVARLLYDGFFDAYDFDVFLLHMGGLLLVGRINRGRDKSADADALPARSMIEYLRELN
jgi:aminocarboxymuconate-semialdehyde decarboxylase